MKYTNFLSLSSFVSLTFILSGLLYSTGNQLTAQNSFEGVSVLWLRADIGVTTAGAEVTTWADQSLLGNSAVTNGVNQGPMLVDGAMNFNPVLRYDNTVDGGMQLKGLAPLPLTTVTAMDTSVNPFSVFMVTAINHEEGARCGSDIFNLFDDDGSLEIETFGPNGCEDITNQETFGVSNGGEFYLQGANDNRTPTVIGLTYSGPGTVADVDDDRLLGYLSGALANKGEVAPYVDPGSNRPANTYSVGQASENSGMAEIANVVASQDFAEILIFPAELREIDRRRVESYLALKYGITLKTDYIGSTGVVIWDTDGTNAGYSNNIAGIGRSDRARVEQRQSRSTTSSGTILTVGLGEIAVNNTANPNNFAADAHALIWGNNGQEADFLFGGGTADYRNRLGRVWKVAESDGVGNTDVITDLDLAFNKVNANIEFADNSYYLAIDRDNNTTTDFTNSANVEIIAGGVTVGDDLVFEGVNLNHNDCFTLVRNSCSVQIVSIDITCDNGNEFDLTTTLSYDYNYLDVIGDDLQFVIGSDTTRVPIGMGASTNAAFQLPTTPVVGSRLQLPVTASFASDPGCNFGQLLNLLSCDEACTVNADQIKGQGFVDFNLNRRKDRTESSFGNIVMTLYDQAGNPQVTLTDADGYYEFSGLDPNQKYRIEATLPPGSDIAFTYVGSENSSGVAFVSPGTCDVDFGGINSRICAPDKLQFVTACFTQDALGNDRDVLISFPAGAGSNSNQVNEFRPNRLPVEIGAGALGAIHGLAVDRFRERIYASGFIRSNTELAGSFGQIYLVDNSGNEGNNRDVTNAQVSPWLDLNANGDMGVFMPESLGAGLDDGLDDSTFVAIGTRGIGDIDLSLNGDFLYAVDLTNQQILEIPVPPDGSAPNLADIRTIALPANTCNGGKLRPFALGVQPLTGRMYVGAVCDASDSQNNDDLEAVVFDFFPGLGGIDPNPAIRFPLRYPRTSNFRDGLSSEWNYWIDDLSVPGPADLAITYCCGNTYFVAYPQPMLSDIEFADDGNMILGIADRFGLQFNEIAPSAEKNPTAGEAESLPAGDILQAGLDAPGFNSTTGRATWTLENNGVVNGVFSGPLTSGGQVGSGPGGNEFYRQDDYPGSHAEVQLGAIIQVPGYPLASTAWDPVRPVRAQYETGGVMFFNNEKGNWEKSVLLYQKNDSGTFAKGAGFGDIESICTENQFYQIGNYVWIDATDPDRPERVATDADGIAGPEESALQGLPVALYTSDGVLLASTVTDANGEYYFTQAGEVGEVWVNPDGTLLRGDSVVVVFGTDGVNPPDFDVESQRLVLNGRTYELTSSNTGEGGAPDKNDSDAVMTDDDSRPYDGFPIIGVRINRLTDFSFDVGFSPIVFDLALTKTVIDETLPEPIRPGSEVSYTIAVLNQGEVDAYRISVQDYLPNGTTYVSSSGASQTRGGVAANVVTTSTGSFVVDSLLVGDTIDLTITLKINTNFGGGTLDNFAEIRSADNDQRGDTKPPIDVDSTPDGIPFNQAGESNDPTINDNVTDQDGKAGGDEDDHDGARITVIPCLLPNCGDVPVGTENDK